MSQTMESFEEASRIDDEPLKYFGKPIEQFHNTMMSERDGPMEVFPSNDEPNATHIRATAVETKVCLETTDIWGPQHTNIHRATRENLGQPTTPGDGGGRGDNGGSGDGGGGGGGIPPPSDCHHWRTHRRRRQTVRPTTQYIYR